MKIQWIDIEKNPMVANDINKLEAMLYEWLTFESKYMIVDYTKHVFITN